MNSRSMFQVMRLTRKIIECSLYIWTDWTDILNNILGIKLQI